jgi:hypothetical protein
MGSHEHRSSSSLGDGLACERLIRKVQVPQQVLDVRPQRQPRPTETRVVPMKLFGCWWVTAPWRRWAPAPPEDEAPLSSVVGLQDAIPGAKGVGRG